MDYLHGPWVHINTQCTQSVRTPSAAKYQLKSDFRNLNKTISK